MEYEIRYARPDEFAAVAELDGASFGLHYSEQELEEARLEIDAERVRVAAVGTQLIAVSGELALRLTLPGGADVPVQGLTWVSVEITHRRRGVLRSLVERQLRDAAAAGLAASALGASEAGIYGRYGFGVATRTRQVSIARQAARLARPVDVSAVRRLTTADARDLLPGLYDRWRLRTPGAISRGPRRWEHDLLDREHQRHGASGLFHLVHPDGYVTYRQRHVGVHEIRLRCQLIDYVTTTPQAHAALWQCLLALDLVDVIETDRLPLDDPLPLLLTDARAVSTTELRDGLWVRPLDVSTLLGERRYGVEVDCVVGVRDPLLGDGRYRLRGGPDGADCFRTDAIPDITVDVADLGSVVCGGPRLSGFVRVGRVEVADPARAARLDLALLADREPVRGTGF